MKACCFLDSLVAILVASREKIMVCCSMVLCWIRQNKRNELARVEDSIVYERIDSIKISGLVVNAVSSFKMRLQFFSLHK